MATARSLAFPLSGGSLTVFASFNGSNGAIPSAGLTLSGDGSTLYGTARKAVRTSANWKAARCSASR